MFGDRTDYLPESQRYPVSHLFVEPPISSSETEEVEFTDSFNYEINYLSLKEPVTPTSLRIPHHIHLETESTHVLSEMDYIR
jgi:hypothetical protein